MRGRGGRLAFPGLENAGLPSGRRPPPRTARGRRRRDRLSERHVGVHWYAGRSKSELAASLGVDRKTIRKYLEPAEASGITPGGPPMREADWAKLITSWFPELR